MIKIWNCSIHEPKEKDFCSYSIVALISVSFISVYLFFL